MRSVVLVAAGFMLAVLCSIGFEIYQKSARPHGALTNLNLPLIQVKDGNGLPLVELKKGDSTPLGYGWYTIYIPSTKTTVPIFKNNRGTCSIILIDGVLVIEVNENSNLVSNPEAYHMKMENANEVRP